MFIPIVHQRYYTELFKEMIQKYFKSFYYFYDRLRFKIFIGMALSILVGVLDGFGLAMFLPLLQMVENPSSINPEGLGNLKFLVVGLEELGFTFNLVTILSLMAAFFVLKGLAIYSSSVYQVILRQFFIKRIRIDLSNKLATMSYKAFVLSDAGRIQNTLAGEVSRVSKAYQSYFAAFQQLILVIVYMVFAFFIDAKFALLICIGGGLTNFIYGQIYRMTKASSQNLTKGSHHYQGLILQFVNYFKYLKATGSLKDYNRKLKESISYIEENNREIGKLGAIVQSLREPILIIVVSIVIIFQVSLLGGALSTILISLLFFYRALSSMMLLQNYYNDFIGVSGSMENMRDFENILNNSQETSGAKELETFKNTIELKDVSFQYSDTMILQNIDLQIRKNETIAIVGESGSGKTTLINILCGLIPADGGKLLIDGVDSEEINLESYQRKIGYITQEPVIFNDTIFNNVSFWSPHTPENYNRFRWALNQALIEDFVDSLPDKEFSLLGNNGINLSGGQKQRLSIARELYKKVNILVLDEATSSIDSETEVLIQDNIDKLQGNFTIILIAHRLSTIRNADVIYILENGRINCQGNFKSLIQTSGKFQKMLNLQGLV